MSGLKRYVGSLRPPIHITISTPGDGGYQELKPDTASILSRSPSPRSSNDDYPPFLPSPISRTVSNDFSDNSELVWLKVKIRNRTIFGVGLPRWHNPIPTISPKQFSFANLRNRAPRCTRRNCIIFALTIILVAVLLPVAVIHQKRIYDAEMAKRGWGWGMPGMDENGWPVWETKFQHLKQNYGGIKELVSKESNIPEFPPSDLSGQPPVPPTGNPSPIGFQPYPKYLSPEYKEEYPEGTFVACRSFKEGETLDPANPDIKVYLGVPNSSPDPAIGSQTLLGLNDTVCFERATLLFPYGFNEDPTKEQKDDWKNNTAISFAGVDWGRLVKECVERNKERYDPAPTPIKKNVPTWTPTPEKAEETKSKRSDEVQDAPKKYHHRTAIVLRAWDGFRFLPDDVINLRRLISEVALYTGGEYAVHILVDVKDFELPIWSEESEYERVLNKTVPEEFRGITELVNEPQVVSLYWGAGWHDSYRSLFMPLQWFSRKHPEYDYIWQWEMDMRLIGHHYHFLESLASWAKKQPRRELWERSTRHYIPGHHGTWEQYSQWVSSLYPEANSTIWGPVLPEEFVAIDPPKPPTATPEEDNYEWGVGEEADLITLLPMFDPTGGTWTLRDVCNGYKDSMSKLPRRSAIVTASRLSKGLLWRMHEENARRKHTCASEMWPATVALQNGLKAVYAPHPIWFERNWEDMGYVESVFNGGTKGSKVKESVFGEMEHNFSGTSWYYNSRWAKLLYRRWMGYEENGEGGRSWDNEHGNMCRNGVLLHPVKNVRPS